MMLMSDITAFIATTLDENTEFKDFCTDIIGDTFKYYLATDIFTVEVDIPFFAIVTPTKIANKESDTTFKPELIIGIKNTGYQEVGNLISNLSVENVEKISVKALQIIEEEIKVYGINGDTNIRLVDIDYNIPTVTGEDDVQIYIPLTLSRPRTLNESSCVNQ